MFHVKKYLCSWIAHVNHLFTNKSSNTKSVQQNKKNIVVFFDGDSVSIPMFKKLSQKTSDDLKYVWVMPTTATVPKKVKSSTAVVEFAPNIGKESVDMLIGMLAMKECCVNSNLAELHIVSSDGDTLEILLNLAFRFSNIKFFWIYLNDKPRSQKSIIASRTMPSNVVFNKVICK